MREKNGKCKPTNIYEEFLLSHPIASEPNGVNVICAGAQTVDPERGLALACVACERQAFEAKRSYLGHLIAAVIVVVLGALPLYLFPASLIPNTAARFPVFFFAFFLLRRSSSLLQRSYYLQDEALRAFQKRTEYLLLNQKDCSKNLVEFAKTIPDPKRTESPSESKLIPGQSGSKKEESFSKLIVSNLIRGGDHQT
jgi:hypothetical protein